MAFVVETISGHSSEELRTAIQKRQNAFWRNDKVNSAANEWDPEGWVDRHGDYLFRYASWRLRNPSDAEEAVQDTLLSAWKNRDQFRQRAAERTWLTGILKNKIVDRIRSDSRRTRALSDEIDAAELDALFDATGHTRLQSGRWSDSPVDEAEKVEFWAAFDKCVAALPTRTANVFLMREIDGIKSDAICKDLEISSSNYWVILHRARLKLRECLQVNWFDQQGLS